MDFALLLIFSGLSLSASFAPTVPVNCDSHTGISHARCRIFQLSVSSRSDSDTISGNTFDFNRMKGLDSRLAVLERSAPASLEGFYEPHLKSFSVSPGSVSSISVTSTCFALQTILAAQDSPLYDSIIALEMSSPTQHLDESEKRIPIRSIVNELLFSNWRKDDLFQVPLLLYTVLKVDSQRAFLGPKGMPEDLAARVRKLVNAVLSARPRRRDGNSQRYSDYIQYQTCQVLAEMYDSTAIPVSPGDDNEVNTKYDDDGGVAGLPVSAVPEGAASQLSLGLARCAETSFNELCRQLAYRSAGDQTAFDVMRLAYSLLTYVVSTTSLSGTAGRELVPGQGPSPGTKTRPLNRRLVAASLAAFFEEQMDNGLWDKGQPIYQSFRRTGRNVGNAFVFAVDTVGSLLESLPSEEFRPHLQSLEKTLGWIESHQRVEVIPDYCDPPSGQCYGKPLRGWASPHIPDAGPEAWSTAQALTCVSRMRQAIRELMHADVLKEFNGDALSADGPSPTAWNRLLDTDLGNPAKGTCQTLKCVLENRILEPFATSVSNPSYGAAYSAILFGPPGTAKTTICEALAQRLGWDFLVIDTSVFLADGLTNVAARIRYVFERLQALDQCVILFDEIEEFCLDREAPGLGMESRMLTTAMLTAINDLRRAERSIFFLATNRLRAFDAAITRPGRFDMQLFVGTPNLEARAILFRQRLALLPLADEEKKKAVHTYTSFLNSVWTEDAMFMNYLEGKQFAEACGEIISSGIELTEEEMQSILRAQAVVMTVRGSVREEYIASMDLSRL